VAFSPTARGLLTGTLRDPATLHDKDLRRGMPRFQADNCARNLRLLDAYAAIARDAGCSMAQLALAWVLSRGDDVIALPGTTQLAHLEDNLGAAGVRLGDDVLQRLDALIHRRSVHGARCGAATQAEIDTEEFPA